MLRITHRDEVEPPITDWLLEAYDLQDTPPTAREQTGNKRVAVRKRAGGRSAAARARTTQPRRARKVPTRSAKGRT